MDVLLIFIGGMIGTFFRYLLMVPFEEMFYNVVFVFIVNMIGCFLIGLISYLAIKRNKLISERFKKFLSVGVIGSFTTFSAFSYETYMMLVSHKYAFGLINMFLSVIVGLILISWGMNCGYYILNYYLQKQRNLLKESRGQKC